MSVKCGGPLVGLVRWSETESGMAIRNSCPFPFVSSDSYFQKERDWLLGYLPPLTQAAVDCGKLIDAEMKISKAYDHLSTTLSLLITAPNGDSRIALYNDVSWE